MGITFDAPLALLLLVPVVAFTVLLHAGARQRMSDMSGTEFLGRVRMLYPDTVRLVLSGYTDLATVTEAINRGEIYRFLTKPWNDDDLREHIRQAFTAYENQPHHRAHA